MWIEDRVSGDIHTELCDYINEFIEEINRLKETKQKESEEFSRFYSNPEFKEYIRIYTLIEERIDEFKEKITNKGILDYCGPSLETIIKELGIESALLKKDPDYREMDMALEYVSIKAEYLTKKTIRINNWNYLLSITLFDNFLVNIIRLLYQRLSILEPKHQDSEIIDFAKKSLTKKVKWFKFINPKLEIEDYKLTLYSVKRNSIVHSAAIVSKENVNKISVETQHKYNITPGTKIEISDIELFEMFEELRRISTDIFHGVSNKFIQTFEERGYSPEDEILNINVTEWPK